MYDADEGNYLHALLVSGVCVYGQSFIAIYSV